MALTKITLNALADSSVDTDAVGANTITTTKIADTNVTHAKLHTDMDLSGKTVTLPSAITDTITNKLPLAGGTLTGPLEVQGNGNATLEWGDTTAIGALSFDTNDNPLIRSYTGKDLLFQTNGNSNRMVIESGGNVGIGTTSPSFGAGGFGLELAGAAGAGRPTIRVKDTVTANALQLSATATAAILESRSAGMDLVLGTSGAEKMRIDDTNGFVHMNSASQIRLTLGNEGTPGTNTANWIRGNAGYLQYNSAASGHTWEISGAEKMRIQSDGNVGIGTNSPQAKLHVTSSVLIEGGSTDSRTLGFTNASGSTGWSIGNGVIDSTHNFRIYDNTAGAARVTVDGSGNVGIGETSPAAKLHINASSGSPFGSNAILIKDGSYETIKIDSGAADGRIQVGAAGSLRGVYKAQHAGTQTNHDFSIIQNNGSKMTFRSNDYSVNRHGGGGNRFDLGWFDEGNNTYQHFKTNCSQTGYDMLFFEYKGYGYSDECIMTAATVYTYGPASNPYNPRYTRYGNNSASGFVNMYYSSDDFLVLVLQGGGSNYTGGWMWAQAGHAYPKGDIAITAFTSTSSSSGAY